MVTLNNFLAFLLDSTTDYMATLRDSIRSQLSVLTAPTQVSSDNLAILLRMDRQWTPQTLSEQGKLKSQRDKNVYKLRRS